MNRPVTVSEADNLTAKDTNACSDVFVRDLATGTNLLVSVNTNGWSGDGVSFDAAISPDGGFVAFTSSADDLVNDGITNKSQQVFLRDLQNGSTTLVSVNSAGNGLLRTNSYSPVVSDGGQYVLYRTEVRASSSTPAENFFVRDIQAGTNFALTTQGQSGFADMTPDGHYIALGAPLSGNCFLYVWDTHLRSFIYSNNFGGVSATSIFGAAIAPDGGRAAFAGNPGLYLVDVATGAGRLLSPTIISYHDLHFSADGLWLVCGQRAPPDNINQIYLYDLQSGNRTQVTQSLNPPSSITSDATSPVISADGRFIAYRSSATNIVAYVTNGLAEVFVYDRLTGATSLLSANPATGLGPNNRSLPPVFSGDGSTLAFATWASDLIPNDFNQNSDIFAYTFLNLNLVSSSLPGAGPWLTWPWVSGKNYLVQFKDDLNQPTWQPLSGTWTNLGTKAWLQDPTPANGQRFYRVGTY